MAMQDFFCYFLWQLSLNAQPLQPQEQDDFPFFFFIISLITIAINTIATIVATIIVGAFINYLIICCICWDEQGAR